MNKPVENYLTRILWGLVKLLSLIPFRAGQLMGRMLGRFLALRPMGPSKASLVNLTETFGDRMSEKQLKNLNRRVLMHFSQMLFEVPHIMNLTRENISQYVCFENEQALKDAMAMGRGCFVLTGHFGNWELMSAAVSLWYRTHGAVVVRPADFGPADEVLTRLRTRCGSEIIPKKKAMKKLLLGTRQNMSMGILLDQNVDWYEGVFVPFLGRWACTNKGLALIAMKTGTPVLPMFSVRQPDGRYRVIFEEPVELIRSESKLFDTEENTAAFNRVIEKYIHWYPDQWFWFHKRWKTKPFCVFPRR